MNLCVGKSSEVLVWQSRAKHQGDSHFNLKFSTACDEKVKQLVRDWNANDSKTAKKLKGENSSLTDAAMMKALQKCRRMVRVPGFLSLSILITRFYSRRCHTLARSWIGRTAQRRRRPKRLGSSNDSRLPLQPHLPPQL